MHHISPEMQSCIDECQRCHSTCYRTAMNHRLEAGGRHVDPKHFRLMMACAEVCQTSVNVMLMGSDLHKHTCAICAEVCAKCARLCAEVGDMQDCVDACCRCAESCRKMAA